MSKLLNISNQTRRLFNNKYTNRIKITMRAAYKFRSPCCDWDEKTFKPNSQSKSLCKMLKSTSVDFTHKVLGDDLIIYTNDDDLTLTIKTKYKKTQITQPISIEVKNYLLSNPNSSIIDTFDYNYKIYLSSCYFLKPESQPFKDWIKQYGSRISNFRSSTILVSDDEVLTACLLFLTKDVIFVETRITEEQINQMKLNIDKIL